jgi:hypothetical protein
VGVSAVAVALGVYAAFGSVTAVAYADGTTSADATAGGSESNPSDNTAANDAGADGTHAPPHDGRLGPRRGNLPRVGSLPSLTTSRDKLPRMGTLQTHSAGTGPTAETKDSDGSPPGSVSNSSSSGAEATGAADEPGDASGEPSDGQVEVAGAGDAPTAEPAEASGAPVEVVDAGDQPIIEPGEASGGHAEVVGGDQPIIVPGEASGHAEIVNPGDEPIAVPIVEPAEASTGSPTKNSLTHADVSSVGASTKPDQNYRVALLTPTPEADAVAWTASQPIATSISAPVKVTFFTVIRDIVVSISNFLSMLPSNPITDLLQGAFMWVRRSFFDEPPTLSPQQTTGQTSGDITGTLGAADAENDPIKYTVVHQPLHGTVDIDSRKGTFKYRPSADFDGTDVFTVAADDGAHLNLANPTQSRTVEANVEIQQGPDLHQLEFKFTYPANDNYWTPQRRTEFEYAAKRLSTYFVVTTPTTIDYTVTSSRWLKNMPAQMRTPCDDPDGCDELAKAKSPLTDEENPGFYDSVVKHKIITGVDANGTKPDGNIDFNFAYRWSMGDQVKADEYDFTATVMHELLHTFGFGTGLSQPDVDKTTGQRPPIDNKNWNTFDRFLSNSTGGNAIDPTNYTWDPAFDSNMTGGTGGGGLYFNGANAQKAYNDKPVPLYSPAEWAGGSSVSHLDDDTFTGDNKRMMVSGDGTGMGVRTLSAVEIAILKDLGYTMVAQTPQNAPSPQLRQDVA